MGGSPSFPVVDLRGRTAIVTGGNTGIGYETAKHLAMMGASVVIACRSEQRAMDAIQRLKEEVADFQGSGKGYVVTSANDLDIEFMALDLSSLKSTMAFITAFKDSGKKLHLLLCNAGKGFSPNREITGDGFEELFQVNYLGHFLIVAHLLEVMKTSGEDCRIVFTSSVAHGWARFNLDTAQAPDSVRYDHTEYYGNSKLYQIQHMFCLGRRLTGSNVTVTCLHPGIVKTELFRDSQGCVGCCLCYALCLVGRSPYEGAVTLIDLAVNPKHKGVSNVYMVDCKPKTPKLPARNEEFQEQLWQYSINCLKSYLPDNFVAAMGK